MAVNSPSLRRPDTSEYAPFYETYVGKVSESDILTVLRAEREGTLSWLANLPAPKIEYRYAPEKWTLRQVFGHVLDMEWVFAARAVHFARAVPGGMPGVEQEDAMRVANFEARPWRAMMDEFASLRAANILFFEGLDDAGWSRSGIASGNPVTVRALAYIIAGHQRHHWGVIRDRYLG
jgi:hypothetical protein